MKELGFENTPGARFVQLIDVLWRAARVVIDVKLSSGEMGFDEAVKFLCDETGMDIEGARTEVTRYTMSPGYQLSYLLGREMLKELRRETKKKMGTAYDDAFFHDVLLHAGTLPMRLMRKELAWRVRERVGKR